MEIILFFIILGLAIFIIIIPFYSESKTKKETWLGILEEKNIKDYYYKGMHQKIYILSILKENGEKVTYDVNEPLFNAFDKGDKVIKKHGEYYPTHIE